MEKFEIDTTTNTLVKFHCPTNEIVPYMVIPHIYKGMQIDSIGPYCFTGITIQKLCIEEGVKKLDYRVFFDAHCIEVLLPRDIRIGEECFMKSSLMSIQFPRDLTTIKKNTFQEHDNLKSVDAQLGVTTIGSGAFSYCKNLESISIKNLKFVGDFAFIGCTSLRQIELEECVSYLGEHIFKFCDNLTSVSIMGSFDNIPYNTF